MQKKDRIFDIVRVSAASAVFSMLVFFYAGHISRGETADVSNIPQPSAETDYLPAAKLSDSARASVLIDAMSGEILYEKNSHERLPMASTTKIMTAIVVIENSDPDVFVKIPKDAVGVEGSSIYLAEGEVMTIRELLYGLMLESGNDAATALAVSVGGTVEDFADMMNKKTEELGLSSTHFDNPHGLTSETHYTTASELAKITAYAMKNDDFRKIVSTNKYVIPERENCRARYFSNHNRLLRSLDICEGVKTGYTSAAGRCLVTCAEKGDSRFVAVTLNDRADWKDHESMLTYAAENYRSISVARAGELVYTVKTVEFPSESVTVGNVEDIYITVTSAQAKEMSLDVEVKVYRDTSSGDVCGTVTVSSGEAVRVFELSELPAFSDLSI